MQSRIILRSKGGRVDPDLRCGTEPRLALCAAPPLPSLGPAPKVSTEVRVAAGAAHKPLLSAVPRASNMTSDVAEFDLGVRRARCVATRASLGPRCDSALAAPVPGNRRQHPEPSGRVRGRD